MVNLEKQLGSWEHMQQAGLVRFALKVCKRITPSILPQNSLWEHAKMYVIWKRIILCSKSFFSYKISLKIDPINPLVSRGHVTLHLAMSVGRSVRPSVGPSVTFLNSERFLHYNSCPTVRDWIAVYPALFFSCLLFFFSVYLSFSF